MLPQTFTRAHFKCRSLCPTGQISSCFLVPDKATNWPNGSHSTRLAPPIPPAKAPPRKATSWLSGDDALVSGAAPGTHQLQRQEGRRTSLNSQPSSHSLSRPPREPLPTDLNTDGMLCLLGGGVGELSSTPQTYQKTIKDAIKRVVIWHKSPGKRWEKNRSLTWHMDREASIRYMSRFY